MILHFFSLNTNYKIVFPFFFSLNTNYKFGETSGGGRLVGAYNITWIVEGFSSKSISNSLSIFYFLVILASQT